MMGASRADAFIGLTQAGRVTAVGMVGSHMEILLDLLGRFVPNAQAQAQPDSPSARGIDGPANRPTVRQRQAPPGRVSLPGPRPPESRDPRLK
jgi:hypothetical protein